MDSKDNFNFDSFTNKIVEEVKYAVAHSSDNDYSAQNKAQLAKRDAKYTELLFSYVSDYMKRNRIKNIFKMVFFIVMMLVLITLIITSLYLFIATNENTSALVGAVTGILSAIIGIPVMITKYLFNPEEDKLISDVVINMQKHDLENRKDNKG